MDLKKTAKQINAAMINMIVSIVNGFYFVWVVSWFISLTRVSERDAYLGKHHSPFTINLYW
jgi:hypothetical protein